MNLSEYMNLLFSEQTNTTNASSRLVEVLDRGGKRRGLSDLLHARKKYYSKMWCVVCVLEQEKSIVSYH